MFLAFWTSVYLGGGDVHHATLCDTLMFRNAMKSTILAAATAEGLGIPFLSWF